ncbi:uncharacterized protein LOC141898133 [Tubulanus polymorphus]|uniref:uncharacterized protein LOC141898133 n=1 Tax=Tubulanus polymorphus TaxID=672921 RepID=UPI003DA6894C
MATYQQPTIEFKVRKTRSVTNKLLKKKKGHQQPCSEEVILPLSPSKRRFDNNANIIAQHSPSKRCRDTLPESPLTQLTSPGKHLFHGQQSENEANEKENHLKSPCRKLKENSSSCPRIGISSPQKLLFSPSEKDHSSKPRIGISSPQKLLSPSKSSSRRKILLDYEDNKSDEKINLLSPDKQTGFKSPVKSFHSPCKSSSKRNLFSNDSDLCVSPTKQLRVNLERIPFISPVKCVSSTEISRENFAVSPGKPSFNCVLSPRKTSPVKSLFSPKKNISSKGKLNKGSPRKSRSAKVSEKSCKVLQDNTVNNENVFMSPEKKRHEENCQRYPLSPLRIPQKLAPASSLLQESNLNSDNALISPRKNKQQENLHYPQSPRRTPRKHAPATNLLQDSTVNSDNVLVSPRKNEREENLLYPQSPRRTPRKRAPGSSLLSPTKSARRSLINKSGSPAVKLTPKTLKLAKQDVECYQSAKKLLHTAIPDRILCRESEVKTINEFVNEHVDKKQPGSLYVSGAPGTGKTAVITKLIDDMKFPKTKVKSIFINCMMLKNTHAIYTKVLSDLHGKAMTTPSIKLAMKQLEKLLTARGPMVILILDEVDQLDSKSQEILYSMFEWPALPKSRLILIGIANALDLTDRILPRLQAQPKCKPTLLNFTPYSKTQIMKILKDRLSDADDVFDGSAMQFCARKVEAVAGDMRRALDICRRAVERVEADVRTQRILTPKDDSTPTTKRKISIAQVSQVVNDVYSTRTMTSQQQNGSIPLQQKLAICTLLLIMKKSKTKQASMGKLYESYNKVCKKRQVNIVDQSEFMNVATLIESRGIFKIKKSKEMRMSKVSLRLDENELEHALQDKLLMTQVLQGGI